MRIIYPKILIGILLFIVVLCAVLAVVWSAWIFVICASLFLAMAMVTGIQYRIIVDKDHVSYRPEGGWWPKRVSIPLDDIVKTMAVEYRLLGIKERAFVIVTNAEVIRLNENMYTKRDLTKLCWELYEKYRILYECSNGN